jgi:hypothetical protein
MNADHTEPNHGAIFALEMLLGTPGRTYSFDEVAAWLAKIGYQDSVEVPMEPPANVSLVLAVRPGKRPLMVLPKPAAKVDRAAENASELSVAADGNGSGAAAEIQAEPRAPRSGKKPAIIPDPKRESKSVTKGKSTLARSSSRASSRKSGAKSKPTRKASRGAGSASRKNSKPSRSGSRRTASRSRPASR